LSEDIPQGISGGGEVGYHSRHLVGTDQIDIRHIDIADITRR
jgi:hypothetical protein